MLLALLGLPGHYEVLILVVLFLLLFSKRLPDLGRSVGRTIIEFRKGVTQTDEEEAEGTDQQKTSDGES